MQEITDAALEKYADNNAIIPVEMENDSIPGMKANTNNKTTAHFYKTTIDGNVYTCVEYD
jgi:hypothetical protein